jgi:hypothetical protein
MNTEKLFEMISGLDVDHHILWKKLESLKASESDHDLQITEVRLNGLQESLRDFGNDITAIRKELWKIQNKEKEIQL